MAKGFKIALMGALVCFAVSGIVMSAEAGKISGEKEFKEHCAVCHPDGGNIINSAKTLMKKDREANGIRKPADIVRLIRNPGPGMTQFSKKTVSDKEAKAIAAYIFKTFK